MSPVLIIILIALAAWAFVVTFALASVAKRADRQDSEMGLLDALARLRSPSGKPFFASRESVSDFVETLDGVRDDDAKR